MVKDSTILRIVSHVSVSKLSEEAVVLDLEKEVFFGLNEVAMRVWSLIAETKTVGQIIEDIVSEFEVDTEQATRDVVTLAEKLISLELVEPLSEADHLSAVEQAM